MTIKSGLERIIKIIKNCMHYTICEHEQAFYEYRICEKYFAKPDDAVKCYEKKQPEFVKIKGKEYLLCPKTDVKFN